MKWCKFYSTVHNDPKLYRLSDKAHRLWVNLLSLQALLDGELPSREDIALRTYSSHHDVAHGGAELIAARLLDEDENGNWTLHQWDEHQATEAMSNAERQKRWRERNKGTVTDHNGTGVTDRNNVEETRLDKIRLDKIREVEVVALRAPPPPLDVQEAFEEYNKVARHHHLSEASILTSSRKSKLRARMETCGGLAGWVTALERLSRSAFLKGANDRGFRADLDFMLQEKSFNRLMEGFYDDKQPGKVQRPNSVSSHLDRIHAELRRAVDEEEGARGIGEIHEDVKSVSGF
jgi:hypothetical protein